MVFFSAAYLVRNLQVNGHIYLVSLHDALFDEAYF